MTNARRWWCLRVNTSIDLYERLNHVADWLNDVRDSVMKPLVASCPHDKVRVSVGPHEELEGPPGELIVLSGGW